MSRLDDAVAILREQLEAAQSDVERLMAAFDALQGVKGGGAARQGPRPTEADGAERKQKLPATRGDWKTPGRGKTAKKCPACKATVFTRLSQCPACGKGVLARV